ncbi:hypothetical protein DVH24_014897 [Malus domestica]|uniref:Malectin-like domain-containing protein n=1 Tax=Malus domestica TaxID=3750 RepID=A0A498K2L2_MALDO|nr:hypothetical protein DVH24_014897 [Malus domestica]
MAFLLLLFLFSHPQLLILHTTPLTSYSLRYNDMMTINERRVGTNSVPQKLASLLRFEVVDNVKAAYPATVYDSRFHFIINCITKVDPSLYIELHIVLNNGVVFRETSNWAGEAPPRPISLMSALISRPRALTLLTRAPTTSRARLHYSMILSVLGPDHALMVLFLRTHTITSQWVTHHGMALVRTRLTLEFRWNLKPVSS